MVLSSEVNFTDTSEHNECLIKLICNGKDLVQISVCIPTTLNVRLRDLTQSL
jgi:hypothetical protein